MKVEATATLPVIKTNFDLAKQEISKDLEKYKNYVVTVDTLADDKKLAQSIKAQGNEINTLRLAKKKELSDPINEFEKQANELKDLYLDASKKISDQVIEFEKITLDKLRSDLIDILKSDFEDFGVKEQFQEINVDHLVKLTNITNSGKPTKKAREGVIAIVESASAAQSIYNNRVIVAESESLEAGLSSPLQEIHIKSFIFADDEQFDEQLSNLIGVELDRQAEVQSKVKAPAQEKILDLPKSEVFEQIEDTQLESDKEIKPAVIDGKIEYICTATFKVTVPEQIEVTAIESKLVKMIEDSGITSLQCVEVKPNGI